jgi:hypothetical protein
MNLKIEFQLIFDQDQVLPLGLFVAGTDSSR